MTTAAATLFLFSEASNSVVMAATPTKGRDLLTTPSSHFRRELYTQCRENGKDIRLSRHCCAETTDLQFQTVFGGDGSTAMGSDGGSFFSTTTTTTTAITRSEAATCDQVNLGNVVAHAGDYCRKMTPTTLGSRSTMNCLYKVPEQHSGCTQDQQAQRCQQLGGRLQISNVTLACDDFSPTITLEHVMTCVGLSCTHHDILSYVSSVTAFENHATLGKCRTTTIELQNPKGPSMTAEEQGSDDRIQKASIVMVMLLVVVGVFLVGHVTKLLLLRSHYRHRSTKGMDKDPNNHSDWDEQPLTGTTKEEEEEMTWTDDDSIRLATSSSEDRSNAPDDDDSHTTTTPNTTSSATILRWVEDHDRALAVAAAAELV